MSTDLLGMCSASGPSGPLIKSHHLAAAGPTLGEPSANFFVQVAAQFYEAVWHVVLMSNSLPVLRNKRVVRWAVQDHAVALAEEVVSKGEQDLVSSRSCKVPLDVRFEQGRLDHVRVNDNGPQACAIALANRVFPLPGGPAI